MDPHAAFASLIDHLTNGDADEAAQSARDLKDWIAQGGAKPESLDAAIVLARAHNVGVNPYDQHVQILLERIAVGSSADVDELAETLAARVAHAEMIDEIPTALALILDAMQEGDDAQA